MKQPIDIIKYWLDVVQTEGKNLSSWEENFVESLREQLGQYGKISDRQEEILETIYANKTPLN